VRVLGATKRRRVWVGNNGVYVWKALFCIFLAELFFFPHFAIKDLVIRLRLAAGLCGAEIFFGE